MKYIKYGDIELPAIALGTWSWGEGNNGSGMVFGNHFTREELNERCSYADKAYLF